MFEILLKIIRIFEKWNLTCAGIYNALTAAPGFLVGSKKSYSTLVSKLYVIKQVRNLPWVPPGEGTSVTVLPPVVTPEDVVVFLAYLFSSSYLCYIFQIRHHLHSPNERSESSVPSEWSLNARADTPRSTQSTLATQWKVIADCTGG